MIYLHFLKKTNFQKLLLLILILGGITINYSQEKGNDMYIFTYILNDAIEITDSTNELVDIKQIKVKSEELNKLLVKFKVKKLSKAFPKFDEKDTLQVSKDGKKIKRINLSKIFKIKIKTEDINSALSELSNIKDILFVEKQVNWGIYGDEKYNEQWFLNNTGQSGGTIDADVDAPEAWQIYKGSSNIKLGIIDSGVETNHDDLIGKTSGDSPEAEPYDDYAHGTHVAGIAGAKHGGAINETNEAEAKFSYSKDIKNSFPDLQTSSIISGGKVKGIDANVSILSKKVFSGITWDYRARFVGNDIAHDKIIEAINEGCNVINNSYGGNVDSYILREAFAYAYKNNVVSVVSMGNNKQNETQYPAAFDGCIIAVGATDHNDERPDYSNYGNHIDVSAPGGSGDKNSASTIISTWRGNSYYGIPGTSMAAPIVSGIATLLKGYNNSLDNDDIENIIKISAEDVNNQLYPGFDQFMGHGRVNARKALDYLRAPYTMTKGVTGGGTIYSVSDHLLIKFLSTEGLSDGNYIAKRFEVRKTINIGDGFVEAHVWGRGLDGKGYSAANPNYGMGFCNVVASNLTTATLRTYVYEVWNSNGEYLGYFPSMPGNVKFNYTILGKRNPLAASIHGPGSLKFKQQGTYTVNASGGSGHYNYQWYKSNDGGNSWITSGTYQSQIYTMMDYDFKVKCEILDTKTGDIVTAIHNVIYEDGTTPLPKDNSEIAETETMITEYSISNYPNPFNPTTTINYQLPESGLVTLRVYDMLGREVAELVNEIKYAGKYTVSFNAGNFSSGIYIYEIKVNDFRKTQKMMLVK